MSTSPFLRVVPRPDRRLEAVEILERELRSHPGAVLTAEAIAERWALEPATAADVLAAIVDAGGFASHAPDCDCASCRRAC